MTETLDNGNALARSEPQQLGQRQQSVGQRGIVISNFEDLWRMAKAIHASGLAPASMNKPETLFVALEMGLEVGLAAMASIRSIAVINGRPAIYGDAALALVRASGFLESFEERIEGNGDGRRAICISKRKGMPAPRVTTFSVADAKGAGLWGKQGPWKQYADRMLQFRARGFNLRDEFGDVLNGMVTVEEAQDIPTDGGGGMPVIEQPKGVAGLLNKVKTSRPVSEGHVLADPETDEVIQEGEPIQQPEPSAEPEVDAGSNQLQPERLHPQTDESEPTPREAFIIQVHKAANEAGITDAVKINDAIMKWAIGCRVKGKEDTATVEQKQTLMDALKEKRGVWAFAAQ